MFETTVVIPAYNRARFIVKAIKSALDQNYPAKEIIVVDDGSNDETASIVHQLGEQVRLIQIDNDGSGPCRPRNIGIDAACTDFVTLLDSDDYFERCLLERHAELLHLAPELGIVSGNFRRYWSDRNEYQLNQASTVAGCNKMELGPNRFRIPSGEAYAALCRGNFLTSCTGVSFRKQIWERCGGFDVSLTTCNDYDFFLRVMKLGDLGYIDEPLFTYQLHYANISAANLNHVFMPHRYENRLKILSRELALNSDIEVRDSLNATIARNLLELAWRYRKNRKYRKSFLAYSRSLRYVPTWRKVFAGVAKIPLCWVRDFFKSSKSR